MYFMFRSGRLGIKNRISWRKDSALKDGFNNFDLSGGYYDGIMQGYSTSFCNGPDTKNENHWVQLRQIKNV